MTAIPTVSSLLLSYKLQKGVSDQSYGLFIAKMAGIPEEILQNAEKFMKERMVGDVMKEDLSVSKGGLSVSVRSGEVSVSVRSEKSPVSVRSEKVSVNAQPEKSPMSAQSEKPPVNTHPIIQQLITIDVNSITPLQALEWIHRLKQLLPDNK